ncbi:hypothetical protein FB639_005608 [Coemansia asiatica]|nr:hypothetical protein FB639_005608 [Coemansia asiatica]
MAEIIACDSEHNAYTISDMDAQEGIQGTWVAHWDQLIAIKKSYEYVYKVGEQVYALYRDDSSTHTQVTTEFFPGRVEHVGPVSLAIRFDTGELGHVYYDEAFAAGRIGFLRRYSEERRKADAHDAMVEFQGKTIPSFTGFWPQVARPGLGKHGRKVRYRQMPPLLAPCEPPPIKASSAESLSPSSDMDIAGSSSGAPSPLPQKPSLQLPPPPPPPPTKPLLPPPPPPLPSGPGPGSEIPNFPLLPKQVTKQVPKQAASSDEEGEIDNAEDGEVDIPINPQPQTDIRRDTSDTATTRLREAPTAGNSTRSQRPSAVRSRSRSLSRSHSPSRRYSRGSTRWESDLSPRRRDHRRSHGLRYSDRRDSYAPRDSYRRRSPSRGRHAGQKIAFSIMVQVQVQVQVSLESP